MPFHGTGDQFAPFVGGQGKGVSGTEFYSVDHVVQSWIRIDGCPQQPQVKKLPDVSQDGMRVTLKRYGPGTDNSEVVLVVIDGAGHT